MKGMKRAATLAALLLQGAFLHAQEIEFDQGNWQDPDIAKQRILVAIKVNEERVDTVLTDNIETGKMVLSILEYPLARYEYYPSTDQFPALWRWIDIRQEVKSDSSKVELSNGTVFYYQWKTVIDFPTGAYHEFFPNGNIRIMGTLDGYNPDGTLKKTGEWKEWDANGKVIRRETYP